MINRLPWRKKLRTSAANNLDKINEIVDYINHSDISPVALSESGSGRSVTVGVSSSLKSLDVHGESIQDGTPTPDNPVPVQVVEGRNLLDKTAMQNGWVLSNGEIGPYGNAKYTAFNAEENEIYTFSATTTLSTSSYILLAAYSGAPSTSTLLNRQVKTTGNSLTLTAPTGTTILVAAVYDYALIGDVQLEFGSTATPYVPYGSIGIITGDNVTPIDLQGNVLASLPDDTHDRLLVDSAGHCVIENTVGHIASYNGESVGDVWLSSTGQLTTDADVYYKIATAQTIDLGYIDMPAIESGDAISVGASIVPVIDAAWWCYDEVTDIIKDLKTYVDYKTAGLSMSRPANISLDTQAEQPAIVKESEMI